MLESPLPTLISLISANMNDNNNNNGAESGKREHTEESKLLQPLNSTTPSFKLLSSPFNKNTSYDSINNENDEDDFDDPEVIMNEDDKEERGQKTNFFWSTFNLWNDVLGSGIVAAPYYTAQIGKRTNWL